MELDFQKLMYKKLGAYEHTESVMALERENPSHKVFRDLKIYEKYFPFNWELFKQIHANKIIINDLKDFTILQHCIFGSDSVFLDQRDLPLVVNNISTRDKRVIMQMHLLSATTLNPRRRPSIDMLIPYIQVMQRVFNERALKVISTYVDREELLLNDNYCAVLSPDERSAVLDFLLKDVSSNQTKNMGEINIWL